MNEYELTVFRVLLEKLNAGQKTVGAKEIESAISDREECFSNGIKTQTILNGLEEKGFLSGRGGDVYDIAVDIATLREAILGSVTEDPNRKIPCDKASIKLDDLMNSEWILANPSQENEEIGRMLKELEAEYFSDESDDEAADPDEDDDDNDDDDECDQSMKAYFESRRRRLFEQLMELDDEGEDEGEDDNNFNNRLQDDDAFRDYILGCLKESVDMGKERDGYVISVPGLDFCGADAKFEFLPCGTKTYLCDRGAVLCSLKERIDSGDEAHRQAERIASESGGEIIDGKLCVETVAAEQTLQCLLRLYAAMERAIHIGDFPPMEADGGEAEKEEPPQEFIEALEYIVRTQKVSIIDLHAEFGCSPNTIGFMLMWMEEKGFITPLTSLQEGRKVLLTMEEFKRRFGKK